LYQIYIIFVRVHSLSSGCPLETKFSSAGPKIDMRGYTFKSKLPSLKHKESLAKLKKFNNVTAKEITDKINKLCATPYSNNIIQHNILTPKHISGLIPSLAILNSRKKLEKKIIERDYGKNDNSNPSIFDKVKSITTNCSQSSSGNSLEKHDSLHIAESQAIVYLKKCLKQIKEKVKKKFNDYKNREEKLVEENTLLKEEIRMLREKLENS